MRVPINATIKPAKKKRLVILLKRGTMYADKARNAIKNSTRLKITLEPFSSSGTLIIKSGTLVLKQDSPMTVHLKILLVPELLNYRVSRLKLAKALK